MLLHTEESSVKALNQVRKPTWSPVSRRPPTISDPAVSREEQEAKAPGLQSTESIREGAAGLAWEAGRSELAQGARDGGGRQGGDYSEYKHGFQTRIAKTGFLCVCISEIS